MEMSLQEIRDFVRGSLDVDAEELSDLILDVHISDGFDRAIGASRTWNFYAVENTITTTPGVQSYNVAGDTGSLTTGITAPLASITDVRGDTWSLTPVDHRATRAAMRKTAPASSRPWGWSEFGQSIVLWPIPDTTYSVDIAGYRHPNDWMTNPANLPDCPSDFHNLLAYHALARGWAQQSDPEMAGYYSQLFQTDLVRLKGRYTGQLGSGPYLQNGGITHMGRGGLGPLIYPFQ